MTAACGEKGQLLELLCQPAELRGVFPLPDELAVWGLDSGRALASSPDKECWKASEGDTLGYPTVE